MALRALDLADVIELHSTGLEGYNTCFTDFYSVNALGRLIEGPVKFRHSGEWSGTRTVIYEQPNVSATKRSFDPVQRFHCAKNFSHGPVRLATLLNGRDKFAVDQLNSIV